MGEKIDLINTFGRISLRLINLYHRMWLGAGRFTRFTKVKIRPNGTLVADPMKRGLFTSITPDRSMERTG